MFVKRVRHPLVFFPKVGPKDQQYFHAVEQSLRKQGACFLRSKKNDVRQSIPGGTLFVCIYIYIHIWDNSQKGGQRFSGSSWEEVGEGGGSFEKRGVDRFCK